MADLSRLFSAEFHADPYPFYAEWRAEDRVLDPGPPMSLLVTGHEEARTILCDPRFKSGFSEEELVTGERGWRQRSPTTFEFFRRSLIGQNPPDHTRLRGLVSRAFTPRVVEALRPRVEAIVEKLLDAAAERGAIDLVADFAYPLPVTVIAELLGLPAGDAERLKRWSQPLTQILDSATRESKLEEAEAAARELEAYLREQFARHRARPGRDLLDGLLAAHDAGDRLSDPELMAICMLLLVAGHETTTNLIGNGVLALQRQRGEWERLRREPGLAPRAVEECLRYDPPVQFTSRRPAQDLEIFGKRIAREREVVLVLGAANRDPARFPDPDRLDVGREDNPHLAFGQGIHFCLGASLARLEAQIALRALVHRFPDLELAGGEPARRAGFAIRALVALPVRLG
jgi:hypothetical protein